MQGLRAVGTPVRYEGERVLGAVSLSGAAGNWSGDRFRDELPERVMRTANAIEVNLHSNRADADRPSV